MTTKADPAREALRLAEQNERNIANEAAAIRAKADPGEEFLPPLAPELFEALYPLLLFPIPEAYIQTVGATQGKPYVSTGIRSVQVQIDRMNNVLTPLWWRDRFEHSEGGKLCKVTVEVGSPNAFPLVARTSYGGVDRGSSLGNVYKGSYTNAAKLAFARLGPGHEVYLGSTDLDPDVDEEVAKAGKAEPAGGTVGKQLAKKMVDRAWQVSGAKGQLQLAASHAHGSDVGDCSTKAKATDALAKLGFDEAQTVDNWITRKKAEAA